MKYAWIQPENHWKQARLFKTWSKFSVGDEVYLGKNGYVQKRKNGNFIGWALTNKKNASIDEIYDLMDRCLHIHSGIPVLIKNHDQH